MLLSDRLYVFDKTIIALSGGHFEYFLRFPENIHACLRASGDEGQKDFEFHGYRCSPDEGCTEAEGDS